MNAELPSNIDELKAIIVMLLEKIKQLEAENAELKVRLGLNSENSNKPPSSDGLNKKTALEKPKKSNNGGQKGHKGNTLKQVSAPDNIIIHKPEYCTCCGSAFHNEQLQIISKRQVFDIPAPKLIVTEHQLGRIICHCGHIETGIFPQNITQPTQYGEQVKALCILLSVQYRLPQEQISQLFTDLYNSPLNTATLISYLNTAAAKLEPIENDIKNHLLVQDIVHFDETGLRVNGKTSWLHAACSVDYTYLFYHPKRGKAALDSEYSLIKYFKNHAVHDCWASYFIYDCKHILCNAHILRELTALIEQGRMWAADFHQFLMDCYQHNIAIDAVESRYSAIIAQADREEPLEYKPFGKKGRPKRTKGRCLLDRLIIYKDAVLAFVFNPDIPFTNNQAERDIRCAKIKMKVSGCFRTQQGARVFARIQSVISTLRKQNITVFETLCTLFSNNILTVPFQVAR